MECFAVGGDCYFVVEPFGLVLGELVGHVDGWSAASPVVGEVVDEVCGAFEVIDDEFFDGAE